MLPFRPASPADFAAVRAVCHDAGYTPARISERCGIEDIHDFISIGEGRAAPGELSDALDVLIRLFLDGQPVPLELAQSLLPAGGTEALFTLGIVDHDHSGPGQIAASVLLYPVGDIYIASDLHPTAPGLGNPSDELPPDYVFSAINALTGSFVAQVPRTPCDRFLELCAGTGIAALTAAPTTGSVWAVDITERSTHFAGFNANLNGVENFTALQGNLYEPVAGRTFDRIAAHPPYVPATENRMVFRDGGADGEDIIRDILAGLPDYLEPGGCLYLTCISTDRLGAPVEDRMRAMLGEREHEFDLLVTTHYELSPDEYYGRAAVSGNVNFNTADERIALYRDLKARRIVYAAMVFQRHVGDRPPFTLRRERSLWSGHAETDWLLRWQTARAKGDEIDLAGTRPRLQPHARLHVAHGVAGGEWKVARSRVTVEYPFRRTVEISMNGAMLLTLFDGSQTVRAILQRMRDTGAIPPEVPEDSFIEFVRELVGEGVLGIDGVSLPVPQAAIDMAS